MRRRRGSNRGQNAGSAKLNKLDGADNRLRQFVALALVFVRRRSIGSIGCRSSGTGPTAGLQEPPVVYNWTGFYIGGNLGAAWQGLSGTNFSDTLGSTFTAPTNVQFMGGGQVGVNYQFWGGVVIGAEAMFDWLPNTANSLHHGNCSRWHCRLLWHYQQSMVDHRDRPPRLCMGPRAPLWQGRRRLGWGEQSWDFNRCESRLP